MNMRWLFMAKRWAQNPPSRDKIIFYGGIFVVCFAVFTIEYFIGWPEMLSQDPADAGRRGFKP